MKLARSRIYRKKSPKVDSSSSKCMDQVLLLVSPRHRLYLSWSGSLCGHKISVYTPVGTSSQGPCPAAVKDTSYCMSL